ncbi:hypothetical protein SBDP2_2090001 [Syntrophobacter sp. SbD2]|nr:hypothetical protein SBDP2_2090001 [Syntrophobacter sp. SbD2]
MNQTKHHPQVWVKVNTPVDSGVAELVCLLNQVDRLFTLDSCQGRDGWGYVYFRYGNWRKLGHFVFAELAPALREIEEVTLDVQSVNGNEPMARLSFRTETISRIVSVLGLVVNGHRSEYSHGRECKGPHN